jgi:hypothetical protein
MPEEAELLEQATLATVAEICQAKCLWEITMNRDARCKRKSTPVLLPR